MKPRILLAILATVIAPIEYIIPLIAVALLKTLAKLSIKPPIGPSTKLPIVGAFIGGAIAAAFVAMMLSKLSKAGDVKSPAKGKTVVSTKEGGIFELSSKDDLVAAPGAAAALDSVAGGSTQQVGGGAISISMQKLEELQSQTNMLLNKIAGTQGTVSLDAEKMGTAISMNTYEISP